MYSKCSNLCFLAASAYLMRSGISLQPLNIHRLLLVSIMVAAKFYDDSIYKNTLWARVGGISLSELGRLEMDFLLLMDFKLLVHKDALAQYALLFEEERFSMEADFKSTSRGRGGGRGSRESSRSRDSSQNAVSSGSRKRRGSSCSIGLSSMDIEKRDSDACGPMIVERAEERPSYKVRDRRVSWAKNTT